ncbi:putative polyketide cyclase [Streptomyces sp. YIM 130001]|uniref:aromatase/cyclase n=1 Tax=Streptomyces sp. YIM 130001 TaxID=2259644 RepID=UPI000E656E6E|nr:aromatase/cyclase [Streptomyces sp. YIM 130001]RII13425.1 putative polyketide cyclase [Streptomyces sp. YIM 130001]
MSSERVHRTTHEETVAAPVGVVYGLVSDAVRGPLYFPPSVHVEPLESDGVYERLRMWATVNGQVESWTSRRTLDPQTWRVEFRHELPATPVQSMGGSWIMEPAGAGRTRLALLHDFTVADDDVDRAAWVRRGIDTNSRAELASLRRLAECWPRFDELVLSFEQSVRVHGPAELAYDFLYRIGDWPESVPHVTRVDFTEDAPGVQIMSTQTRTADGSSHTTESVRVCFPHAGRIVHKQTATPRLVSAHSGAWDVVPDETGATVIAQHTVVLNEEHITEELGEDADTATARRYVRDALGRTSTAMLDLAKEHAESAVTVL